MDTQMDIRIRALAHPLWESAARPYGMALDFWLMAEQMIFEMLTASARLASAAAGESDADAAGTTGAASVARVQDLAQCMWENAGRQYELALDCWLSAERHVMTLTRANRATREGTRELATLPPPVYLDHIRRNAYQLWEAAGQQYGSALDYWLQAEQQVLQAMAEAATPERTLPATSSPAQTPAAAAEPSGATTATP